MKHCRGVPAGRGHPPGSGGDDPLWLSAKVACDVQEQLPREPGRSFVSRERAQSGWEKARGKRRKQPCLLWLVSGDEGLDGSDVVAGRGQQLSWSRGPGRRDLEGNWAKLSCNNQVSMQREVLGTPPARRRAKAWASPAQAFSEQPGFDCRDKGKRGKFKPLDIFPFSNAKQFHQGKENPIPILSEHRH